jgi:Lrp/AsnC family leucine-responsive transcriptional regulator
LKTDQIDEIDRRILRIVQQDGRKSMREIADKIGKMTKVAISYRIKRLIKIGAIEGFYAKINPNIVGQGYLFITGLSIGPKRAGETAIAKKIAALEGVQSVFQTFGEYDALVIGRVRNAEAARDLIYRMLQIGGVRDSTSIISHTVIKESLDVTV